MSEKGELYMKIRETCDSIGGTTIWRVVEVLDEAKQDLRIMDECGTIECVVIPLKKWLYWFGGGE